MRIYGATTNGMKEVLSGISRPWKLIRHWKGNAPFLTLPSPLRKSAKRPATRRPSSANGDWADPRPKDFPTDKDSTISLVFSANGRITPTTRDIYGRMTQGSR